MAAWCETHQVPLLLPFSDDLDLERHPYVLQFNSTDQQEADSLCAWMKTRDAHFVAVEVRDDDLAASVRTLRKQMRAHGIPYTALGLHDLMVDSASYALDSEKENISSLSDAEILDLLLQKLAEGDMDALRDLYERVSSAVYTFALSVVQNPTTAEDVMQDAFVNIAQNANKYVSQGKPMAWIMTITKNIALMKLKRMDNRNSSLEDYMDVAKTDDFAQSDRRLMLRKALSELKDEDRQIVILHAMTGMKHREIAEIMKIPLPTVLTKYKRSLEKMRRTIGGDDIE